MIVYRVQADDGRGPYRPGLTRYWCEDIDTPRPPAIHEQFPDLSFHGLKRGMVCGCACRSLDALTAWFTPKEMRMLESIGYFPVEMTVDGVLRESADQVVFFRKEPLTVGVTRLPWSVLERETA